MMYELCSVIEVGCLIKNWFTFQLEETRGLRSVLVVSISLQFVMMMSNKKKFPSLQLRGSGLLIMELCIKKN